MDVVDKFEEYGFIGNDFLTWMWFMGETSPNFPFVVGNKIVFSKDKDTVTIKGDESELIIGKVAMTDGYVVSEMQLVYSADDPRFSFTMKGNELSFNGLKVPKVIGDDNDDEDEGLILTKISLVEEITSEFDNIYESYITSRVDHKEWNSIVEKMKYWINEG